MAATEADDKRNLIQTLFTESFPGKIDNDWAYIKLYSKTITYHCLLSFPESWRENPDFAAYLAELCSSGVDRLGTV